MKMYSVNELDAKNIGNKVPSVFEPGEVTGIVDSATSLCNDSLN